MTTDDLLDSINNLTDHNKIWIYTYNILNEYPDLVTDELILIALRKNKQITEILSIYTKKYPPDKIEWLLLQI